MKKYALVPALAADLARQLDGHPPEAHAGEVRELYKFQPITAEQFDALLLLVARGASVECRWTRTAVAVEGSGISPAVLCRYLADPDLRRRFSEAREHWRKYRGLSVLDVDEILDELACGDRSLWAVCISRGMDRAGYARLQNLFARAPEVEERYHNAKRAQHARIGGRLFEELGEVSSRKEARAIAARMDLLRRRMPHKIRTVFRPQRTPIEQARRRAGLRLNGKPRLGPGESV